MKNKGFTLIELLAVIVILGIAGTMITISFNTSLHQAKQDECDDFVREIEEAACGFTNLLQTNCNSMARCKAGINCCSIELRHIVEEGLLKSEKDSCTNGSLDLDSKIIPRNDNFRI